MLQQGCGHSCWEGIPKNLKYKQYGGLVVKCYVRYCSQQLFPLSHALSDLSSNAHRNLEMSCPSSLPFSYNHIFVHFVPSVQSLLTFSPFFPHPTFLFRHLFSYSPATVCSPFLYSLCFLLLVISLCLLS